MMDTVDLNDIRIFTVVGQEGTLSAAALKLKLPTSTVSRALTRLEKSLGTLLIRRSSRGHVLTDSGREYLQVCRRALRTLDEGGEMLALQREQPSGLITLACPITMTNLILTPIFHELLGRYPQLRLQIESYTPAADQEFSKDIDVVFKVRTPRDSVRRMRVYPSTRCGLFANIQYIETFGMPSRPEELPTHTCIGSGPWQLSRGNTTVTPSIQSPIILNDPSVLLDLTLENRGIALLPLYMAKWPETASKFVEILPRWTVQPVTLCALFSGHYA